MRIVSREFDREQTRECENVKENIRIVWTTLWTYRIFVLLRRTFNTTANTTNSYEEQLWANRSSWLLLKLSCRTLLFLYVDDSFTAVHKHEIDTFHGHLNRQNAETKDYYLQETDLYRQITRPVIVQPYFSQSNDHTNFDKTSATSLRFTWQLSRRNQVPWQRFQ